MRRGWEVALVVAVLVGGASAGCTAAVPGIPAGTAPQVPDAPADPTQSPTVPSGPRSVLVPDPIPDECLLNASEFGALIGGAVRPPVEATVDRGDGSTGSSCVVTAGSEPIAMINVYRVRSGTPADYVRAGGRRVLADVGQAAAVIDTATGPTLQLASPTYLVTILVSGRKPADDAWRAAAAAALSRLPTP